MGFDISIVADILKFPSPLFPKYKNTYPIGVRYDIAPLIQDFSFELSLPPDNNYELQGIVFSSTGYKDGDAFSILVSNIYVAHNIYTKELGQQIEVRPVKQIKPEDVVTFIFHNNTGTSKVVWLDYLLTAQKKVTILP